LVLYNMMIVRNGQNLGFPLAKMIGTSTARSFLVQYFRLNILPWAFSVLSPILPSGAQLIFLAQNT
jgi:hypothetical protein